jgi:hypothetical protein
MVSRLLSVAFSTARNLHEGLARQASNPGAWHDGGYQALCPWDTARGYVGNLDCFLSNDASVVLAVVWAVMSCRRREVHPFELFGTSLDANTSKEPVSRRGVSKPCLQRILLICQLLGDVTGVGPIVEVRVGRVGGDFLVGCLTVFCQQRCRLDTVL